MTRQDIKRHLGWTPNFKKQPTEEERIKRMEELILHTEQDLRMYKQMLAEKDFY